MLHKLYRITYQIANSLTELYQEPDGLKEEKVFEDIMKMMFEKITQLHKNNYPMPLVEEWLLSVQQSAENFTPSSPLTLAECREVFDADAKMFFQFYDSLCLPLVEKISLEENIAVSSGNNLKPNTNKMKV